MDEGLLCAALIMEGLADEFMAKWLEEDPRGQQRYLDLCTQNGTLDAFNGNPLAFIVANRPACCLARAEAFVAERR